MPDPLDYASQPLRRAIGLPGAAMLGLGAILGSGVFVGLPQATAIAGPWVLVSILLAGGLAFCNAMSSAQLAAAHPVSGGTYEYGYRYLSPAWGFAAGWSFLLAKSASAATAALGVADAIDAVLLRPHAAGIWFGSSPNARLLSTADLRVPIAIMAVVAITVAVLLHLRRTAALNHVIVSITIAGLLFGMIVVTPEAWSAWRQPDDHVMSIVRDVPHHLFGIAAILRAAALCFVGYAGYARLATIGEEVREPSRTIPRAILICLLLAVALYAFVGWVCSARILAAVDLDAAHLTLPDFAGDFGAIRAMHVLAVAAVTAMLGVLLNLVLGLSRVWLAMGRRGDMPIGLSRVGRGTGTPVVATIVTGTVIALLVLVGRDVKTTWSFSAFSVLIYYAITNLACLQLPAEHRRFPRALAWIGLFACLSLAWFVEVRVWVVGVALIAVGLLWHLWRRRRAVDASRSN